MSANDTPAAVSTVPRSSKACVNCAIDLVYENTHQAAEREIPPDDAVLPRCDATMRGDVARLRDRHVVQLVALERERCGCDERQLAGADRGAGRGGADRDTLPRATDHGGAAGHEDEDHHRTAQDGHLHAPSRGRAWAARTASTLRARSCTRASAPGANCAA